MPPRKKKEVSSEPQIQLLKDVVRALDDKKAADLRVLRVSAQSSITDHLVLATGTSDPHLRALRVELEKVLDSAKAPIAGMETSDGSGWTVVDAYQLMVHLFTPEKRDLYRLERLWKDAEEVPLSSLLAKPPAKRVATARPRKTNAPAKPRKAASKVPAARKPAAVKRAKKKS